MKGTLLTYFPGGSLEGALEKYALEALPKGTATERTEFKRYWREQIWRQRECLDRESARAGHPFRRPLTEAMQAPPPAKTPKDWLADFPARTFIAQVVFRLTLRTRRCDSAREIHPGLPHCGAQTEDGVPRRWRADTIRFTDSKVSPVREAALPLANAHAGRLVQILRTWSVPLVHAGCAYRAAAPGRVSPSTTEDRQFRLIRRRSDGSGFSGAFKAATHETAGCNKGT